MSDPLSTFIAFSLFSQFGQVDVIFACSHGNGVMRKKEREKRARCRSTKLSLSRKGRSELQVLQVLQCVKMKKDPLPPLVIHLIQAYWTPSTTFSLLYDVMQIQGLLFLLSYHASRHIQENDITLLTRVKAITLSITTTTTTMLIANLAHAWGTSYTYPAIYSAKHVKVSNGVSPLTRIAFPSNDMTLYYLISPRGKYV